MKSKSTVVLSSYGKTRSKTMKKDLALSNPIFIDTKSIVSPPIVHTSANQMLGTTLPAKQQSSAFTELMAQKNHYQRQYKTPPLLRNEAVHQVV